MSDRRIEVHWLDSCRDPNWTHMDSIEPGALYCVTVGFLIREDAESITVASSLARDGSGHQLQACLSMTIPLCSVTGMWELSDA